MAEVWFRLAAARGSDSKTWTGVTYLVAFDRFARLSENLRHCTARRRSLVACWAKRPAFMRELAIFGCCFHVE
jgi:hypothetical protein